MPSPWCPDFLLFFPLVVSCGEITRLLATARLKLFQAVRSAPLSLKFHTLRSLTSVVGGLRSSVECQWVQLQLHSPRGRDRELFAVGALSNC